MSNTKTLTAPATTGTPKPSNRLLVLLWYALAAIVSGGIAATVIAVWPAGAASAVPYSDPQASGSITLYDKAGKVVTSGNVHDKPFVWKAVSSRKAPAPYDKSGAKATLLAYQPREGAPAPQWSGDSLTASTAYSDLSKPTVQATATDFSLQDFLDEFPARWDGLIQLRIYFGAPDEPTLTSSYATTDIRISGDKWSVVRAGSTNANSSGNGGSANGGSANNGGSNGGSDNTSGDSANASSPAAAILPDVGTPGILIIAAAAFVGVVALGLLRRNRVPRPAAAPATTGSAAPDDEP
jgi:hypothetical protein